MVGVRWIYVFAILLPAIHNTIGGLEIAMALELWAVNKAQAFDNVADQRVPEIRHFFVSSVVNCQNWIIDDKLIEEEHTTFFLNIKFSSLASLEIPVQGHLLLLKDVLAIFSKYFFFYKN